MKLKRLPVKVRQRAKATIDGLADEPHADEPGSFETATNLL